MRTYLRVWTLAVFVVLLGLWVTTVDADYVGSDVCKACHASQYNDFIQSGHPYKVSKVEDGKAPAFPFSEVPNPPSCSRTFSI